MSTSLFDNPLFPLFHDAPVSRLFAADHTIALYNRVEAALARAAAAENVVSQEAADGVLATLSTFAPTAEKLSSASRRDGLPVPGYAKALKDAVGEPHAAAAHVGSTTQDIMDTALALALKDANAILAERLASVLAALGRLDARFGAAPLMGRTRMQAALPIKVADRLFTWRAPLERQQQRFGPVREGVAWLQFGGAVGTRGGWNGRGNAIARRMAEELALADPGAAWQTGRDGLAQYAAWLSATSAALGKVGQDVVLMAQQGLGEVAVAGAGTSSAMPHKQNPVVAEALVTLARFSATQVSAIHHAALAEQERSGIAWALEWMVLPQMVLATSTGLALTAELLGAITRLGAAGSDQ